MCENERHMRPLALAALACALIAGIVLAAWYFWPEKTPLPAEPFALYENGAYRWYRIEDGAVVRSEPFGPSAGAAVVSYPGGTTLRMTDRGLFAYAEGGAETPLVERAGATPELASLSPDGSIAVLYNEVTHTLDAFTPAYQGASASYAGSVPLPGLPSYLIAAGAVPGGLIVVHAGPGGTFTFYKPAEGERPALVGSLPFIDVTP